MNLTGDWTAAPLVALDLEGSGAQDRDNEAILEIALVPITAGQPGTAATYTSLVNPGRPIPRRPWISLGLTTIVLAVAPFSRLSQHLVEAHLLLGDAGLDFVHLERAEVAFGLRAVEVRAGRASPITGALPHHKV